MPFRSILCFTVSMSTLMVLCTSANKRLFPPNINCFHTPNFLSFPCGSESTLNNIYSYALPLYNGAMGYGVVEHSPPTSEVGGSNPEPYVGKMVVSYRWSAVYTTETSPTAMYWSSLPIKLPIVI